MNSCICCHGRLLRHLSHHRAYWFCPTCHQPMPNLDELVSTYHFQAATIKQSHKVSFSTIK